MVVRDYQKSRAEERLHEHRISTDPAYHAAYVEKLRKQEEKRLRRVQNAERDARIYRVFFIGVVIIMLVVFVVAIVINDHNGS
jgi:CHASE3 domain sensor protein